MDLVIDFGTSTGKAGFFNGDVLVEHRRGIEPEHISELGLDGNIENLIISSVSHDARQLVDGLQVKGSLLTMSSELNLPITLDYKTPQTLGMDRLAAVVGASVLFPGQDVLVIDAGSCITYDLLTSDKVYLGGSISPGIEIRFKALHNYTVNLPLVERVENPDLTGKSTSEAMQSGVIYGTMVEIREIIRMYRNKFPLLQLVICGGDSTFYHEHLSGEVQLNPDLVLFGLKTVLDHNV